MSPKSTPAQRLILTIKADVGRTPEVAEVALFLYDFVSLYEILRLGTDPEYKSYRFSRFCLYRKGRPLLPADRMVVRAIRLHSPLEVITTIAAPGGAAASVATAAWSVLQVVEKVYNLRLNRQKLELEIRKLKGEAVQTRLPLGLPEEMPDPLPVLMKRNAAGYLETLTRRLRNSRVQVTDIQVEISGSPSDPKRASSLVADEQDAA
ncbi:MAG: hypothetical protein ABSG98_06025 [Anaerolineales bacterium]|jgi:hypothetical protein